jgi:hypothetical protein
MNINAAPTSSILGMPFDIDKSIGYVGKVFDIADSFIETTL